MNPKRIIFLSLLLIIYLPSIHGMKRKNSHNLHIFCCTICGKIYPNEESLTAHLYKKEKLVLIMAEQTPPYMCSLCYDFFENKELLIAHKNQVHRCLKCNHLLNYLNCAKENDDYCHFCYQKLVDDVNSFLSSED